MPVAAIVSLHIALFVSTATTHQSISNPNGKDTGELEQLSWPENSFNQRRDGYETTTPTLPAKRNQHTLLTDKNGSESRFHHLCGPEIHS
jgi:hypothetical protein